MKIIEWLKEKIGLNKNTKNYTNLIIVLCAGIVLVIISNFYKDITFKESYDYEQSQNNNSTTYDTNYLENKDDYLRGLEKSLSLILSKVTSAGKVSVMITCKGGKEIITDKDNSINDKITDEKDNEGGTRIISEISTNEKTVIANEQGGGSEPVIIKEINPEIKGVIVVAEGASDPEIKRKLNEAVQIVLDIPAYRVIILDTK